MRTIVENMVLEAVSRQPWWQRYANTVVAGIGALAALLGFLATFELPIRDEWAGLIPTVIAFLTALGIKLTKNGLAPSAAVKLEPVAEDQLEVGDYLDGDDLPMPYQGATSVPDTTPSESGLPVWDMGSSADTGESGGKHRLTE